MSRLPLLLLVVTELMRVRTALVADGPSLKTRLEQLYEKLERLTIAPPTESLLETYAAKIDELNAIGPERDDFEDLTDDDEELLTAMQLWAEMSPEQISGMAKELQMMRMEEDEPRDEEDTFEEGWNGDEPVYPTDDNSWDQEDDMSDASTSRILASAVTPSSIVRQENPMFHAPAPVDPIAATNRRPRILDDSGLTNSERSALRRAALTNMGTMVRVGRCRTPQPRWLRVREMAPASDLFYVPPCVMLHRCAPDAGCCDSEEQVCAPVDGAQIVVPFYVHRADGNFIINRMEFYNHTKCGCIPRNETLQRRALARTETEDPGKELQSELQPPTEESKDREEVREQEEESTAPPMMKRCTCPTLFLARPSDRGCACVCDWPDATRRRDCLSLSRGREHFGMRDRVCIANGDCTYPACDYGGYVRDSGRCPLRRFRTVRYHRKGTRYTGA